MAPVYVASLYVVALVMAAVVLWMAMVIWQLVKSYQSMTCQFVYQQIDKWCLMAEQLHLNLLPVLPFL